MNEAHGKLCVSMVHGLVNRRIAVSSHSLKIFSYNLTMIHCFPTANGTCIFWNNEPNVVSFYNDLEIREEVVEFPAGATIVSR